MNIITFTKIALPYGWMSNMSAHPVTYNGRVWKTTEALFQALRFYPGTPVQELIRAEKSPMAAKMMAKKHDEAMKVRPRSDEDITNMALVLQLKLNAHPSLALELVQTKDAEIIEDCTKRANTSGLFWGAALDPEGSWRGNNHLGKLWMQLRSKLI